MRNVLSSNAIQLGPGPDVLDIGQGDTLCTVLANTAELCGDHLAYSDRLGPGGQLRTLTWRQFRETTRKVAAGLIAQGVSEGDRVAIMASDRIEHIVADAAALHAGAIPVPIYLTAAAEQIAAIAAHDGDQVARVSDSGNRVQQGSADPTEHSGIGGDAERQCKNGHCRKAWILSQHASSKAEILPRCFQ